jgi:nitroreductase
MLDRAGQLEGSRALPDLIDLLKARRSVKPIEMTGPGPSPDELETILTLGARVPDHGKLVPWRFIVFEGDARAKAGDIFARIFKEKNPSATADQVEVERKRFLHAPLVIGVVSRARPHVKIPIWEQELSAGASAMNIVTAANALGYVTSWLTGWIAFDRAVLDALGLAPDERMAGFVHIGRAKRPPEERARPQLSSIVTRF